MFWGISTVWTAAYFLGLFLESKGVIDHSPMSIPFLLLGLIVAYGISGINIINEWERRPVLLFGKYVDTKGPGLVWIDPIFHKVLDDVAVLDSVSQLLVENVQTQDNVRLTIIGVLTTRIRKENVRDYVVEVEEPEDALIERAIAAVTETVGRGTLDYILGSRDEFSSKVKETLSFKVSVWGIDVRAVEIKDFKIADPDVEKAIAMKARAQKEAQAELMRAEMQKVIAEQLRGAAHTYDEATWRLKSLETLIELCRSANNNTVIVPTQLLGALSNIVGDLPKTPTV